MSILFIKNIVDRMAQPAVLNKLKTKYNLVKTEIADVKSELSLMRNEIIVRAVRELELENQKLRDEIEATKRQLIHMETGRGVKQIPINKAATVQSNKPETKPDATTTQETTKTKAKEAKAKPEKTKKSDNKPVESSSGPAVDVSRLDMRIGRINQVERHPDADSLYVSKIDCGEAALRTVVSGLVKFIPQDQLAGRLVVLLCNLKPAKMRGITSEAMVMCASTPEKVEVLSPPEGSQPGDLVHCEGYDRNPDDQLNPKKKVFETCAPDLKTNDSLVACYKDSPLHVPGKGTITAQTLRGVQVK